MERWLVVPNLYCHVAPLDVIGAVVPLLIPMWYQWGANVVSTSSRRHLNTTAIEIAPEPIEGKHYGTALYDMTWPNVVPKCCANVVSLWFPCGGQCGAPWETPHWQRWLHVAPRCPEMRRLLFYKIARKRPASLPAFCLLSRKQNTLHACSPKGL